MRYIAIYFNFKYIYKHKYSTFRTKMFDLFYYLLLFCRKYRCSWDRLLHPERLSALRWLSLRSGIVVIEVSK